jgi:hypothetical protein
MTPASSRSRRGAVGAVVALLVALAACGSPGPPAAPGPTGPVGPVASACDGVTVVPADDIQSLVDAHPPGTTFCLAAGTHRVSTPLAPRDGDAFVGEPGAVLSGSRELTGWRQIAPTAWSTTGFLPSAPSTYGECIPTEPACTYAEDVFLDKQRLHRVASLAAVTSGTVYADYARNSIVIGDDPGARLVEQAVAPSLIRGTVDDVTVENLVIEQAANEAQVGAIENRQVEPETTGSGWRILHNEIRLNHGLGIGFGDASTVSGNLIHQQGQLGFAAWGRDSVLRDNEIADNGVAGYSFEWEAGGSKIYLTRNLLVSHNDVHDNRGPGLWTDGGNIDTTYEYNRVVDNWGAGIQHEISYDARITHNLVTGNGRSHKGWAWEAGIQIQSSGGGGLIEVAHNVVADNANGVTVLDSGDRAYEDPAPYGPHVVQNIRVHDNTIIMSADQGTGVVEDTGRPDVFLPDSNIRFDNNTYRLDSLTGPHFYWNGEDIDWYAWTGSGNGNDIGGRASVLSAG